MTEYRFTIDGQPFSKNDMNRMAKGKPVNTKAYKQFKSKVATAATFTSLPLRDTGRWEIEVVAYWNSETQRKGVKGKTPKGDADVDVPLCDALEKAATMVWNDAQFTDRICRARVDKESPRTEVTLRRIG